MVKEITIDVETARRLLFILSLEGDVKREEIEWALGIIHQIPGYGDITLGKAAQDRALKEVLVAIAAEQVSPTTPKNLETLIEDAQKRKAALETAEKTGERETAEFIKAAERAAKAKAQAQVSPPTPGAPQKEAAGIEIKITPGALAALQESLGKTAGAPFRLVTFFSPARAAPEAPARAAAFSSAMSLSQISAKAKALPEAEGKRLMRLVENFRQAEFSFYAQVKLRRTSVSVQDMILLMGPEFGRPQGEVVALVRGGAPPGRGPSFTDRVGRQVLGGLAQRAVSKAATKAVTSALTKAGISLTTKAVAGGIGTATGGPAGTAVGLAVAWLAGKAKDFLSWLKRNAPQVAIGLGVFLLGAGFVLKSSFLMGGGVLLGSGGLVAQAGGVGPALFRAGGFASSAITGVTSLALASIATPLLVALISIPALVAILLFIINSGAYIVPPSPLSLSENPYIRVEKKASPEGPFQNGQIPLTIQYTITITALKGSLTNISFDYNCEVIKRGSPPSCPPAELAGPDGKPISEGPQPGLSISPVAPYVITYSATYSSSSFQDSAIIDTLTIKADVPEEKETETSGSAAIVIGTPPTGCFVFTDDWPADAKAREIAAVAEMSGATVFMTKLCGKGNITLDLEPQVARWGGWTKGYKYIVIYPLGVGTRSTALYTLSHESGHVLAQVTDLYQRYLDTQGPGSERPICTYPVSPHAASEDFAEMVALYFSKSYGRPTTRFSCLGGQAFKTKYPLHWSFARNSIFLENLGW